jgi:hypothetical protein
LILFLIFGIISPLRATARRVFVQGRGSGLEQRRFDSSGLRFARSKKMDQVRIGKLLGSEAQRDAVHVAIAPVVAAMSMSPGENCGLDASGLATIKSDHIGIVDPFLKSKVKKGDRFYLFLYPNTVTSLRHHWIHPAFGPEEKAEVDMQASVAWVTEYARKHCPYYSEECAYDRFMESVREGSIFFSGNDLHALYDLDDADDLFYHLSIILGRRVDGNSFEYSCSC